MTTCVFSPAARNDIDRIYDYTALHWGIAQAERYVGGLRDTCHGLAEGQLPGRDIGHVRAGYRQQASGSHFVFYKELPDGIEIVRVLHRRMDLARHL